METQSDLFEALRRAQWLIRRHNIRDDLFDALCRKANMPAEIEQVEELIAILDKTH